MEIELWKNGNDRQPVADFIEEINNKKHTAKILKVIDFLEEKGLDLLKTQFLTRLTLPKVCLYELRIKFGSDIYRILLQVVNNTAVLLHGFTKKSEKTPQNEIQIALSRCSK